MNVTDMTVILLSLSFSMVLVAMIPGTPHPVPTRIGMKDFPERPKNLNTRSMTKAALAMYPMSSSMQRTRNSTSIWGRNPMTAPTPPMKALLISPVSSSLTPLSAHHSSTEVPIGSSMYPLRRSVRYVPIPVKSPNPMTPRKTMLSTPRNIGIPRILWVTILSILSEVVPVSRSVCSLVMVPATISPIMP